MSLDGETPELTSFPETPMASEGPRSPEAVKANAQQPLFLSKRHRQFSKQKTELEFTELEHAPCVLCGDTVKETRVLIPISSLKMRLFLYVQNAMKGSAKELRDHDNTGYICLIHLQKVLEHRIDELLEEDLEQLYKLQEEGIKVLGQYELEEENWLQKFEMDRTFGQRAADGVATIGGSWSFLFSLLGFIIGWAILNAVILNNVPTAGPWDPYPFILLNLLLSCTAAFQSPIILMSQNRQVQRDRMVNDYVAKIILRNEHQTRHVNDKLDHLLSFQWKRLLEIQEIQTVLMQVQRRGGKSVALPSLTGKLTITKSQNPRTSNQYMTLEISPDPFAKLLLRRAFHCNRPDDTLIFSHWHEDGDNFTGTADHVQLKSFKLKLKGMSCDLIFQHHHVTLDDVFSGEHRLVLRNDFNVQHMQVLGMFCEIFCNAL